jgi:hypothetical protein
MKKLKTILTALLFVAGAATVSAKEKPDEVIASKGSANHQIKNMMQLPGEFLKEGFNETVKVFFLVNNTGEVNQVLAVCTNPELKKSVEAQFSKLSFGQFKENTLYSVNINFKVI